MEMQLKGTDINNPGASIPVYPLWIPGPEVWLPPEVEYEFVLPALVPGSVVPSLQAQRYILTTKFDLKSETLGVPWSGWMNVTDRGVQQHQDRMSATPFESTDQSLHSFLNRIVNRDIRSTVEYMQQVYGTNPASWETTIPSFIERIRHANTNINGKALSHANEARLAYVSRASVPVRVVNDIDYTCTAEIRVNRRINGIMTLVDRLSPTGCDYDISSVQDALPAVGSALLHTKIQYGDGDWAVVNVPDDFICVMGPPSACANRIGLLRRPLRSVASNADDSTVAASYLFEQFSPSMLGPSPHHFLMPGDLHAKDGMDSDWCGSAARTTVTSTRSSITDSVAHDEAQREPWVFVSQQKRWFPLYAVLQWVRLTAEQRGRWSARFNHLSKEVVAGVLLELSEIWLAGSCTRPLMNMFVTTVPGTPAQDQLNLWFELLYPPTPNVNLEPTRSVPQPPSLNLANWQRVLDDIEAWQATSDRAACKACVTNCDPAYGIYVADPMVTRGMQGTKSGVSESIIALNPYVNHGLCRMSKVVTILHPEEIPEGQRADRLIRGHVRPFSISGTVRFTVPVSSVVELSIRGQCPTPFHTDDPTDPIDPAAYHVRCHPQGTPCWTTLFNPHRHTMVGRLMVIRGVQTQDDWRQKLAQEPSLSTRGLPVFQDITVSVRPQGTQEVTFQVPSGNFLAVFVVNYRSRAPRPAFLPDGDVCSPAVLGGSRNFTVVSGPGDFADIISDSAVQIQLSGIVNELISAQLGSDTSDWRSRINTDLRMSIINDTEFWTPLLSSDLIGDIADRMFNASNPNSPGDTIIKDFLARTNFTRPDYVDVERLTEGVNGVRGDVGNLYDITRSLSTDVQTTQTRLQELDAQLAQLALILGEAGVNASDLTQTRLEVYLALIDDLRADLREQLERGVSYQFTPQDLQALNTIEQSFSEQKRSWTVMIVFMVVVGVLLVGILVYLWRTHRTRPADDRLLSSIAELNSTTEDDAIPLLKKSTAVLGPDPYDFLGDSASLAGNNEHTRDSVMGDDEYSPVNSGLQGRRLEHNNYISPAGSTILTTRSHTPSDSGFPTAYTHPVGKRVGAKPASTVGSSPNPLAKLPRNKKTC